MVAIKFLGILAAAYFFVVREVLSQNFYPARYGKREESDFQGDALLDEKRQDKGEKQNALTDRKIRFFISGGRYGKRGCSTGKCSEESKELFSSEFSTDQDRNGKINVPIRKSQFMVGSRFGKRVERDPKALLQGSWCILTRIKDYYRCLTKRELEKELQLKSVDSTFFNGIIA